MSKEEKKPSLLLAIVFGIIGFFIGFFVYTSTMFFTEDESTFLPLAFVGGAIAGWFTIFGYTKGKKVELDEKTLLLVGGLSGFLVTGVLNLPDIILSAIYHDFPEQIFDYVVSAIFHALASTAAGAGTAYAFLKIKKPSKI